MKTINNLSLRKNKTSSIPYLKRGVNLLLGLGTSLIFLNGQASAESPIHGAFPYYINAEDTFLRINSSTRVPFELAQGGKNYRGVGKNTQVRRTGAQSRRGGRSIEFTTEPIVGGPRSHYEIDLVDTFTSERGDRVGIGDTRYLAFSFRLDGQNFPTPTRAGFSISQVRIGDGISPLTLMANSDGDIFFRGAGPGRASKALRPYKRNVWYDIVMGWKYDPFGGTGYYKVWLKEASESQYQYFEAKNLNVGYTNSWRADKNYGIIQGVRAGMYIQNENVVHRVYYDEIGYSDDLNEASVGLDPINNAGGGTQLPSFKYDFGTSTSPRQSGYLRITPSSLSGPARWTNGSNLFATNRNLSSPVDRDLIYSRLARTFVVSSIPNGNYRVTVRQGDTFLHDNMVIKAEGITKASNIDRARNQWSDTTFNVTVNDGRLDLEFSTTGGSDVNWVVNSVLIGPQ